MTRRLLSSRGRHDGSVSWLLVVLVMVLVFGMLKGSRFWQGSGEMQKKHCTITAESGLVFFFLVFFWFPMSNRFF